MGARSPNQKAFIDAIKSNDLTFCHGPAGTGKTHVAVGMAVNALRSGQVERIILCRPAVESSKSLGYLPGTLEEKMDPYLRPLFDELAYYVEKKVIPAWMEHGVIEICPLSYVRGRTFNNAYIVLDEAQNAEADELLMFLTRIGLNSKMVLVGDLHQSDLPPGQRGGLRKCIDRLNDMEGVGICALHASDIVRHRLIGEIISRLGS